MTVLQAMSQTKDENGNIVIPVGSMHGDVEYPGSVTEEWLRGAFGDSLDTPLPLTVGQYGELESKVQGLWSENWRRLRDMQIITVQ